MTDPQPLPFRLHVADRLIARSPDLTRAWLERIVARLPESPRRIFPSETLLNHIPEILEKLVRAATVDEPVVEGAFVRDELAKLASLRRAQGYGLDEVLIELDILRDLLFDAVLDEARRYEGETTTAEAVAVTVRLHRAVTELSKETATAFGEGASLDRLERARLLSAFSRSVTHELRNRLNTAVTTLLVLRESYGSALPEEGRELVRTLEEVLRRTESVASDVFAVSATHARERPVEGRRQTLRELVGDVVSDLEELGLARGVALRVVGDVPDVQVDATRLQLALINLITNGIKYADPAEPAERFVEISVRPAGAPGTWQVDVADNGVGIPDGEQERIFGLHVRGGDRDGADGDGIGLAIAADAVAQLGGRIWVRSRPGRGSTFSFTLREPPAEIDPGP